MVHHVVHLTLLGGFRVRLPGVVLREGNLATKAAALLKILGLRPHHEAHRDEVAETLWPNRAPGHAHNNVYKAIHHIRSSIAGVNHDNRDFVQLRKGVIALAPWVIVDVDVFVTAANSARESQTVRAYDRAIALGRHELLPCNRYDDWASYRRDELRELVAALQHERSNLTAH